MYAFIRSKPIGKLPASFPVLIHLPLSSRKGGNPRITCNLLNIQFFIDGRIVADRLADCFAQLLSVTVAQSMGSNFDGTFTHGQFSGNILIGCIKIVNRHRMKQGCENCSFPCLFVFRSQRFLNRSQDCECPFVIEDGIESSPGCSLALFSAARTGASRVFICWSKVSMAARSDCVAQAS